MKLSTILDFLTGAHYRLYLGGPKMPSQVYTPPTPPPPAPPPPPPAARAATMTVRERFSELVPRAGRRSTMITNGLVDASDGRRRSLLGTPLTKPTA